MHLLLKRNGNPDVGRRGYPEVQAVAEHPKCHFAAPAGAVPAGRQGQERSEKSYNVNNNNIPTIWDR